MNDYVDTTQQIEEDVDRASFYRSLEDDLDSGKALTWTHLKGLMRFSLRSDKGKELGLWSLGEISEALGENWLSAAKTMDSGLDRFCYWAAYRNDIFLEIVEFALSLNVFKNVQGFAKIRRDIKNDASFDRFWHSRAVCQLGRQALMAGHRIAFEKKKTKFSSPIDLVIASKDGLELCCEVFCIFRSESMVNGFEHSDRISNIVERIASTERVLFDGHWKSMPDDATLECILEHIQELAATGSRTGEIHELHNVYLDARISPSNDRLGGLGNYSGPTIQGEGLERVLNKLRGKIRQAHSSGATWIYMEVNDDLWQLTKWAEEPLKKKLDTISPWLVEVIRESNWCHGIILTSGVTTALALHTDETVKSEGGSFALRRYFAPGSLRVRESIIVPASLAVSDESRIWFELLASERAWLEWALRQYGLIKIEEMLSFTSI